uniref:Clc-like protein n=1 Tax=Trichuris muris TaxID=70415 RepID=A0A5S6PZJ3_TRIMR
MAIGKTYANEMSQRKFVILKLVLHALAGILTVVAVSLIISGVVTPAWQVVNVTQLRIYREHGLWMDCVYGTEQYDSFHRSSPGVACSLKLERAHKSDHAEPPDQWAHVTTLSLLCTSAALGVIGLSFFCCAYCFRAAYICWAISNGICMLLSCVAVILFFHVSHEFENRVLHSLTEIYEQKVGYSFWLAVSGSAVFVLCLMLNVLCAILVYLLPSTHVERPRGWLIVNQHEDTLV